MTKNNTAQKYIPQGWQEKKLGDVCHIVNGSTPKRSVSEYWENGNIPWFTVDDIRSSGRIINKTNQNITDRALKETSVKLLPEDSVLLCCTASLGEVALTKIPITTNQQFNGLVSKDKKNLFPYYLFYSAQKLGENLKSKSGKTTINFLSVSSLSKEKILLPSIHEQQKISEIFGTVDEDIAQTQKVIGATEKLKRGLMQQLFTRRTGHKEWKEIDLIDCFDLPPKLNGVKQTEYLNKGEFPIFDQGQNYISGYSDRKDLVVTNVPAVLFGDHTRVVKYIKTPFVLGADGTKVFWAKENINSDFLYYLLLNQSIPNTGYNRHFKFLKEKIVFIPLDIKEQSKIAEILSAVDEKISINRKLKEKLTLLKKGLMQDLLSGSVRVNN